MTRLTKYEKAKKIFSILAELPGTTEEEFRKKAQEMYAQFPPEKKKLEERETFCARFVAVSKEYLDSVCKLRVENFSSKDLDDCIAYLQSNAYTLECSLSQELNEISNRTYVKIFHPCLKKDSETKHSCAGGCSNNTCCTNNANGDDVDLERSGCT